MTQTTMNIVTQVKKYSNIENKIETIQKKTFL